MIGGHPSSESEILSITAHFIGLIIIRALYGRSLICSNQFPTAGSVANQRLSAPEYLFTISTIENFRSHYFPSTRVQQLECGVVVGYRCGPAACTTRELAMGCTTKIPDSTNQIVIQNVVTDNFGEQIGVYFSVLHDQRDNHHQTPSNRSRELAFLL